MANKTVDHTAIRTALWRALHVEVDDPPYVFEDVMGLRLISPSENWRERPDMDPENTKLFRASIVARARFIEDLVLEQIGLGIDQYVILGAGLDTFAQRRPATKNLRIFEIDQPSTLAWKQQRLGETQLPVPDWLTFVSVNFEAGDSWLDRLVAAGFEPSKPAVVASTGVSLYLTRDAIMRTLCLCARLALGSTLAMTYILPPELADDEERPGIEMAMKGARAGGTPFNSFFTSIEMKSMAIEAGFRNATHVSAAELLKRYFSDRTDGFHPPKSEEILIGNV